MSRNRNDSEGDESKGDGGHPNCSAQKRKYVVIGARAEEREEGWEGGIVATGTREPACLFQYPDLRLLASIDLRHRPESVRWMQLEGGDAAGRGLGLSGTHTKGSATKKAQTFPHCSFPPWGRGNGTAIDS